MITIIILIIVIILTLRPHYAKITLRLNSPNSFNLRNRLNMNLTANFGTLKLGYILQKGAYTSARISLTAELTLHG